MHIGVLIPVKSTDKDKGRNKALVILQQDKWCWNESVYDEDGEFDEELDAQLNADAVWDYPYSICDRWYDGLDENSTIYPGTTVAEFKDKYIYTGFISEQNLTRLFEFVYNINSGCMEMMSADMMLKYIMELPDDTLLYVGSAHI